ncbi:outer membrane beta-barrel protein [Helicobacter sp. T3_23-1056]
MGIEVGVNSLSFFGDKNRTFPFNAIFGYQHFFTHRHGLEIRANLGYSYDYQILYDRYASSADLHSVQYGLEMAYLLNFGKSKEKFAWGMDFGLGIGAVSFLGKLNGGDLEQTLPTSNSAVIEHNTIAYLTMLRLGFHWYYTSHLFWLNFKANKTANNTNARNNRYNLYQTPQTILDANPSFLGLTFSYAYRF